jgi:hypothetical protein
MLAQLQQAQPIKVRVYSMVHSNESVEDLLKKIGAYQLNLQKILSKALTPPEKKLSISLRMFLNESKNRLHLFILTFDEIIGQTSLLSPYDSLLIRDLNYSFTSFQPALQIVDNIFAITTLLCETFTQLKENIETSELSEFDKSFIKKSLIFYKQTQVVLKGYLRTIKVQQSDPW